MARDVVSSTASSGERVLLHLPTGTYLLLDDAAARIVDLLGEDPDPAHAAGVLVRTYGIPVDRALGDVRTVVDSVRHLTGQRIDRGRRPTVNGARAVWRAWLRQPWPARWTILRSGVMVGVIEVGLATVSLPHLARALGVPLAADRDVVVIEADNLGALDSLTEREQRAHWAVDWVLSRWLFDGTCLRRALAFGWSIRDRRPVLRLGMIDAGGTVAHAWVDVDGQAFDATAVTGSFVAGGVDDARGRRRPAPGPGARPRDTHDAGGGAGRADAGARADVPGVGRLP